MLTFPLSYIANLTMSNRILVTYASRNGSTAGVAETIGLTLSNEGFQVDVIPVDEVHDISIYQSIIVGSAIQAGHWLPEAIDFVKEHKSSLSKMPYATFTVCMTLAMPKSIKYQKFVESWLEPIHNIVKPLSEGYFAGFLCIKNIHSFSDRLKFRLSVIFGVWKEGDHRNWEEIRTWTLGLKPYFKEVE